MPSHLGVDRDSILYDLRQFDNFLRSIGLDNHAQSILDDWYSDDPWEQIAEATTDIDLAEIIVETDVRAFCATFGAYLRAYALIDKDNNPDFFDLHRRLNQWGAFDAGVIRVDKKFLYEQNRHISLRILDTVTDEDLEQRSLASKRLNIVFEEALENNRNTAPVVQRAIESLINTVWAKGRAGVEEEFDHYDMPTQTAIRFGLLNIRGMTLTMPLFDTENPYDDFLIIQELEIDGYDDPNPEIERRTIALIEALNEVISDYKRIGEYVGYSHSQKITDQQRNIEKTSITSTMRATRRTAEALAEKNPDLVVVNKNGELISPPDQAGPYFGSPPSPDDRPRP